MSMQYYRTNHSILKYAFGGTWVFLSVHPILWKYTRGDCANNVMFTSLECVHC